MPTLFDGRFSFHGLLHVVMFIRTRPSQNVFLPRFSNYPNHLYVSNFRLLNTQFSFSHSLIYLKMLPPYTQNSHDSSRDLRIAICPQVRTQSKSQRLRIQLSYLPNYPRQLRKRIVHSYQAFLQASCPTSYSSKYHARRIPAN